MCSTRGRCRRTERCRSRARRTWSRPRTGTTRSTSTPPDGTRSPRGSSTRSSIACSEKRKARSPGPFSRVPLASDGADLRCRRAFRALRRLELDLLAFLQRLEPAHLDLAVMGEEVLAAVVRRDEAEALRIVEPLDRA